MPFPTPNLKQKKIILKKFLLLFQIKKNPYICGGVPTNRKISYTPSYFRMDGDQA